MDFMDSKDWKEHILEKDFFNRNKKLLDIIWEKILVLHKYRRIRLVRDV